MELTMRERKKLTMVKAQAYWKATKSKKSAFAENDRQQQSLFLMASKARFGTWILQSDGRNVYGGYAGTIGAKKGSEGS